MGGILGVQGRVPESHFNLEKLVWGLQDRPPSPRMGFWGFPYRGAALARERLPARNGLVLRRKYGSCS